MPNAAGDGEVTSNFRAQAIDRRVRAWAAVHASNDVHFGTPYAFISAARRAEIITEAEYEIVKDWYAELWHFRGD